MRDDPRDSTRNAASEASREPHRVFLAACAAATQKVSLSVVLFFSDEEKKHLHSRSQSKTSAIFYFISPKRDASIHMANVNVFCSLFHARGTWK